jgi:hypothetical protein
MEVRRTPWRGTSEMSEMTAMKILALCDSIEEHRALVESRIRDAGMTPDPFVAESVAKYWQALEKLAAE